MKNTLYIIGIIVILLVSWGLIYYFVLQDKIWNEGVIRENIPIDYSYFWENWEWGIINCTLKKSNSIVWMVDENWYVNEIKFEWDIDETEAEITLVWLDTDEPKLKWNNWTTPLTKIYDDWNVIYLTERALWNIILWSFFPKQWILMQSKQYWFTVWWTLPLIWVQQAGFCDITIWHYN